ncbi:MAG: pectinesterase family protein [Muribaculaceae bacterium]|nr:pectinesterase family protein [Muribaculaceae bacterium]
MRDLFKMSLSLLVVLFACSYAWAADTEWEHVTTPRNWEFTKGSKHAEEVKNCEYWSAGSKGRYSLAKALDNQELPSNTGAALTDLDGVYFTVASGAVYGISANYCFQNGKITVRIPGCGRNDEIIVDFSGAGGEATVTSDNITQSLTMPANISAQSADSKASTKVKENGDVILEMSCGKGFRLYGISVTPYIPKERHFTDFKIDFTTDPYTVVLPTTGQLPEGVTVSGTWHDSQHGYNQSTVTVPVDGAVKITIGNCTYNGQGATIKKGDTVLATLPCNDNCDGVTTWTYNSDDDAVLTIVTPSYCPSLAVEACDLIPDVNVSYYNTDGSLMSKEVIPGGSALVYKYGASDVIIPDGQAFRGWFASTKSTALKVAEGTTLQTDTELYARATAIEEPTSTSRYVYDLTKAYFYVEDHEAIEIDGSYYNNHGWLLGNNGTIKVKVAGKCYVSVGCCQYSTESTAVVKNEAGETVAEFPVKAEKDGDEQTFQYDGAAGWLTITFPTGAYIHSVSVSNVVDFIAYNEASGFYEIPAGDVSSFLLALKAAASKDGAKIYLPNGTYDLGTTTLTAITGKNISIIGESMKGTVILNYPPLDAEGISVTATLLNRSENLYLQDLTLRNAMPFDGKAAAGRAVTLQDKGKNTICKNVSLESYQDTYYSNNTSAYFYFEDGEIHGVVDYVCGGGDVYYNRVKFVNEAVKNTTIAAPNGAKKFGYVMNNCTIETLCSQFNFGRSWGTYSGLAWLNTTINQPSKLASSRFTTGGMNCAADKFVEYNSMDNTGKRISPSSNVLEFTHSSGNKKYETILTDEEAKEYAIDKVFPDWRPEEIAAQETYKEGEDVSSNVYLVDGKIYAGQIPNGTGLKVRKANARGGFGPEVVINYSSLGEISIDAAKVVDTKYYNMMGVRVDNSFKGLVIKVETLDNGKNVVAKVIKD